ncbi:uncharacterized protein METZ01_LOCUS323081, partial [marine metagenome]
MVRKISIQFLLVILISGTAFSVSVTFQVDMASEDASEEGVHIAGIHGWFPDDFIEMSNDGDNIYKITIDLSEGTYYYLFINGKSLSYKEENEDFSICGGIGSNRLLEVSNDAIELDLVCFSSCQLCGDVSVTIQVDMTNETINDGVHIAGSMQSWDPTSSEMTDTDGDGIYAITFNLTPGDTIQYKFINGNSWDVEENTSGLSDCSIEDGTGGQNRYHIVGESDEALAPVCFGHCVDCSSLYLVTLSSLTFKANMSNAVIGNGFNLGD